MKVCLIKVKLKGKAFVEWCSLNVFTFVGHGEAIQSPEHKLVEVSHKNL